MTMYSGIHAYVLRYMSDEDIMGKEWKDKLNNFFEEVKILKDSQKDARNKFEQYCEFIVEPAFESVADVLKEKGIRCRWSKAKGRSINLHIYFKKSRSVQFSYGLVLPNNIIRLEMFRCYGGRKSPKHALKIEKGAFFPERREEDLLAMEKEELIEDLIERYRNFVFESLTDPAT